MTDDFTVRMSSPRTWGECQLCVSKPTGTGTYVFWREVNHDGTERKRIALKPEELTRWRHGLYECETVTMGADHMKKSDYDRYFAEGKK